MAFKIDFVKEFHFISAIKIKIKTTNKQHKQVAPPINKVKRMGNAMKLTD